MSDHKTVAVAQSQNLLVLWFRLWPTTKSQKLSGPNNRLWPKVKIAPTVQHCGLAMFLQVTLSDNFHIKIHLSFKQKSNIAKLSPGEGSLLVQVLMQHSIPFQ